jgi:hypothetical protein
MTANIFGDRFFGRTGPAWHEIGTTDPNITTCVAAVKKAKIDFKIFLAPVSGQVETPMGIQLVDVPNKRMILREPTHDDPEHRFLGFASPEYGIMQNIDIAKAMDVLTDTWPCETVGALGVGETLFMTLDAGMFKIKGEDVKSYFLISDTRDGGTSMKIALTPVRVVCQNTLVTGLKQSMVSVSLEHVAGIGKTLESRLSLVKKMTAAKDVTIKTFEEMAKYSLKKSEVDFVLSKTYPTPKKPKKAGLLEETFTEEETKLISVLYQEASEANSLWEYYVTRSQILKDAASELFEKHNDEFKKTANTSWGLFNAIVESADFRRGSDSIAESCLFGARAQEKKRGFAALQEVMVR